jgi:hypothetical protein
MRLCWRRTRTPWFSGPFMWRKCRWRWSLPKQVSWQWRVGHRLPFLSNWAWWQPGWMLRRWDVPRFVGTPWRYIVLSARCCDRLIWFPYCSSSKSTIVVSVQKWRWRSRRVNGILAFPGRWSCRPGRIIRYWLSGRQSRCSSPQNYLRLALIPDFYSPRLLRF